MRNLDRLIMEAVDAEIGSLKKKRKVLSGDDLAKECYSFLSINAQKGFDSELLIASPEKNEVKFKNGARILYDIMDPSEDVIEWRLIDRTGNEVEVSDEIHDKIEEELLDLVVDEVPFEYREDEEVPGYEIGNETRKSKEEEDELSDDQEMLQEGKGSSKADSIESEHPEFLDDIVYKLMHGYSSRLSSLTKEIAYKIEQELGACWSYESVTIPVAKELIARAMAKAKEQGYSGTMWKTEVDAENEKKAKDDEQMKDIDVQGFADFLRNVGTFEYYAKDAVGKDKKPTKNLIIDLTQSYLSYKAGHYVEVWGGNRCTLGSDEKNIGRLLLKALMPEFKKCIKEKEAQKQDTPQTIKENFFRIFNKLDGNKYFLNEISDSNSNE